MKRFAPNDPGYLGYVSAFRDIVSQGERALRREWNFDVSETIALTRWGQRSSAPFRWFRLLTAAVEVLLDASHEAPHYPLCVLLNDSFTLERAGDDLAPTDLLSKVCQEVSRMRHIAAPDRAFCVLGELLLAERDGLHPSTIEALCSELEAIDRRYHNWWEYPGAEWIDQPKSDEFLWSLTFYDQLHATWLDLIDERFPVVPARAAAVKQRLLADGARWRAPKGPA